MHNKYTPLVIGLSVLAPSALADWWQPEAGTTWQIVLSDTLKAPYGDVDAIDGDLFANSNSTWSSIKAAGIKTICYFSAGSYEDWRPDAKKFNKKTDLGAPLDGWPGEWWLNTRSANVRKIMTARLDLAVAKGCDAVDPDNVDAYGNNGGGVKPKPLTKDDAVNYLTFLSQEAHKRGLAIGLKNAGDIIPRVLDMMDFEVNEQCQQYDECDTFQPFIDANKPVFEIEYTPKSKPAQTYINKICNNDSAQGFSTLIKHMNLNKWVISCPVSSSGTSGDSKKVTKTKKSTKTKSKTQKPKRGVGNGKAADGMPLETVSPDDSNGSGSSGGDGTDGGDGEGDGATSTSTQAGTDPTASPTDTPDDGGSDPDGTDPTDAPSTTSGGHGHKGRGGRGKKTRGPGGHGSGGLGRGKGRGRGNGGRGGRGNGRGSGRGNAKGNGRHGQDQDQEGQDSDQSGVSGQEGQHHGQGRGHGHGQD